MKQVVRKIGEVLELGGLRTYFEIMRENDRVD